MDTKLIIDFLEKNPDITTQQLIYHFEDVKNVLSFEQKKDLLKGLGISTTVLSGLLLYCYNYPLNLPVSDYKSFLTFGAQCGLCFGFLYSLQSTSIKLQSNEEKLELVEKLSSSIKNFFTKEEEISKEELSKNEIKCQYERVSEFLKNNFFIKNQSNKVLSKNLNSKLK